MRSMPSIRSFFIFIFLFLFLYHGFYTYYVGYKKHVCSLSYDAKKTPCPTTRNTLSWEKPVPPKPYGISPTAHPDQRKKPLPAQSSKAPAAVSRPFRQIRKKPQYKGPAGKHKENPSKAPQNKRKACRHKGKQKRYNY